MCNTREKINSTFWGLDFRERERELRRRDERTNAALKKNKKVIVFSLRLKAVSN